ncbi:MAG TPA: hypothetical protein VLM89_17390, partial [Phycisphaerae bacterium]|nr:hypothetical protein [Phycisphaerae bacterium]
YHTQETPADRRGQPPSLGGLETAGPTMGRSAVAAILDYSLDNPLVEARNLGELNGRIGVFRAAGDILRKPVSSPTEIVK